jgi:phosphatidylserine/phosphatidylglycerophosphate/cardiolipin synthase-like enzyme/regulation of enolase protein 1 (concanavalin A-like superfamily)
MRSIRPAWVAAALLCFCYAASPAGASESLCDPAYQDCRTTLINYIRNETVGIDVAFWFMEDARYSTEIINRWKAGVPVRVIMDQRALPSQGGTHPDEVAILQAIVSAGIPVRQRSLSVNGILHWKAMIFAGQNVVEFDGANYSPWAFIYVTPYSNYEWESVFFTDDPSLVNSFKTWFDNFWIDYSFYADYANITNPPARIYPIYPKDPALNFPQQESYYSRIAKNYVAETQKIDVIMFRITDERHTDQMIAAMKRGIPVRIIGDTDEYRLPSRQWVSYNLDKLYAAGVPLRVRGAQGLNHQKLVILYGQQLAVFGSSNWTTPSDQQQQEHNYFTTKPWMFQWFVDQFERKWNNTNPAGVTETQPFVPLPPDKPVSLAPASGAVGQSISMALKWDGGFYAQFYDIYFGTDPNPPLFASNLQLGPTDASDPTTTQKIVLPLLQHGTTYYWRIVSRTMAGLTAKGPTQSFTTYGATPLPVAPPPGATTIVAWTATDVAATDIAGNWQYATDSTAAGGRALWNPDKATAKISPPLAAPTTYFEIPFNAMSGTAYHLWVRLRAQANSTLNDSVSVQFNDSIDRYGSPLYQIGTPQGAEVILQDPSGTLNGWGWADNSFGGAPTPIYFTTTGPHRLRVQQRTDGAFVDQIILSPDAFISASPGATSSDTQIYGSTLDGAAPPMPSSPPPPIYPPVPSPWQQADIGAVGLPGYAEFDNTSAVFSVAGAGADVWGTADALHYVYEPLSGDGTIVTQVTSVQNINAWVKAGVMIRESLAANARQAFMLVSFSKGTAFQRRQTTGGGSVSTSGSTSVVAPYWVRIDRSGNTFSAYQSADGATWKLIGTDTIAMAGSALIGLAVSSHTTDAAALATFAQVAVNGVAVTPPPPPPPPSCTYSISPAAQSIAAGAASLTVTVSTAGWCSWTAVSNSSWVGVASGATATGTGTVTLNVDANTSDQRTGTVTIAGQTFTITQAVAPPCTYTISPLTQSIGNAATTLTVAVTTASYCSWTAVSNDPWIGVANGSSGTGAGVVTLNVDANTGPARMGTPTIAGQTFTINQAAPPPPCTYAILPASASLPSAGGTGTITLTASDPACTWTATPAAPWISIAGGNSGSGSGSVGFIVAANTGDARSGTIGIADQTFAIAQAAAPPSQGLPSGWSHQDVGTVGVAGDATYDPGTGTFTVIGAGADVWGTADALHYAYTPLTGDGSIVARVATVQNTNAWTKAGVMIRETVDPASAQGFMLVSFSKGTAFQRRRVAAGTSVSTTGLTTAGAPYWVRVDRVGNTINAYQSFDGNVWALVDTDTIAMGATVTVGLGVSSHSTTATATATFDHVAAISGTPPPPPTLPSPWLHQDIGAVGAAGAASFNPQTNVFTVKGAGADIWGTADALHFAYKPLTGDGVIVARVASVQNVNSWTKGGVMIRETLDPGSAQALMLVSASKGLAFQRRPLAGGTSTSTAGALVAAPEWLKLERIGSTFNAYASADGTTWALVGTDTIPMAANVYVGFAVSSHTTATAAQVTFDNVTVP